VTKFNPQLEGVTFGATRLVEWQNRKGETLRGAVLLPAGYAKYLRGEHTEQSFDRADALDYFDRVIAWFDRYLKD
jgi:hypothetical protein